MAQKSYDVLLVDQTATLDEIKLAFKRRALQVHPDKGGSKEEFQLVYQAFETLVDPKVRRKYDHQARQSTAQKQCRQRHKTSKKRGNGSSAVPKPKGKTQSCSVQEAVPERDWKINTPDFAVQGDKTVDEDP